MPRRFLSLAAGVAGAMLAACQTPAVRPQPPGPVEPETGRYHAQHWWIPVPESPGSAQTISLEAMVYRPPGDGPFPLVEFNHGVPLESGHFLETRPGFMRAAHWFVDRGFAVVVPLRRGFGRSQGDYQPPRGCSPQAYVDRAQWEAQDAAGAVRFMQRQTFVDPLRVLVVGQSAGGLASLALATDPPPGVLGVLNFAGGMGSDGQERICGGDESLIAAMANLALDNRLPQLWLYAENDHFFSAQLADTMFKTYSRRSKPPVAFVRLPPFGSDGHGTLERAPTANWETPVAAFVDRTVPGLAAN